MVKISPSILAADFTVLGAECQRMLTAGADMLHFDVMDGMFVPNISIGLPVLQSLKNKIDTVYDVHLMIENPEKYIDAFCNAGASILTVHLEACKNLKTALMQIRKNKVKAAISIKPNTPPEKVFEYLDYCDMVLVMSVEPGFGGQEFMPSAVAKLKVLKREIKLRELDILLEVDGGINLETARLCKEAGVDILVAGSAVFNCENAMLAIQNLRNA